MRYKIHPKGRPSASQWVTKAQYDKIKAHPHGKNMVIAEEDDSPSEFGHPRPILPKEVKKLARELVELESFASEAIENLKNKAKAKTEASPAPQHNKGKTNGA